MLECAECQAKVSDEHESCPKCGGHLLGPPALLQRRSFLILWYGAGLTLVGGWFLASYGAIFLAFFDRALAYFGLSPTRAGAATRRQRLFDTIRDSERETPLFPGAARLHERLVDNRAGTAPAVDVCWQAPAGLDEVVTFYRQALPAARWAIRRDATSLRQLGAEQGQVRLLVHGPDDRAVAGLACPPETTYVLSFTATNAAPARP